MILLQVKRYNNFVPLSINDNFKITIINNICIFIENNNYCDQIIQCIKSNYKCNYKYIFTIILCLFFIKLLLYFLLFGYLYKDIRYNNLKAILMSI